MFAPVYVMFTKADLITGFTEFFSSSDKHEYDRVWAPPCPTNPTTSVTSSRSSTRTSRNSTKG